MYDKFFCTLSMVFCTWENCNVNVIAFTRAILEYQTLHNFISQCHLQILLVHSIIEKYNTVAFKNIYFMD